MSEHDEAAPGGGPNTDGSWRERAAFYVCVDYAVGSNGGLTWRTRAYHEESDTHMVWPGPPAPNLLAWMAAATQPFQQATALRLPPPADPAVPPGEQPADDFKQIIGISAAAEHLLHQAGIRTYAQLAASSPSDLAALLGVPAERIKRGWITRASALAKLAPPPNAAVASNGQAEGVPAASLPTGVDRVYIEILFDENGDVCEQWLLREGESRPRSIGAQNEYLARFFVEQPLGQAALPSAAEVELEVDNLRVEESAGSTDAEGPRLRAVASIRPLGLGVAQLVEARPNYLAHLLAYNLDTGETRVLRSVAGQLQPALREVTLDIAFALPEIGRYQVIVAVSLSDYHILGVAAGPRLRVTP